MTEEIERLKQKAQGELLDNKLHEALATYLKAYKLAPDEAALSYQLACILEKLGDLGQAELYYQETILRDLTHKQAYIQLSYVLYNQEKIMEALEILRRAEDALPGDRDLIYLRSQLAARNLPAWHLPMLADAARNQAYEKAIQGSVQPDDIVLDIGTGSGLLSLMAARAGAKHVYACESDPVLAALAQDIVQENGFGDKITIINKASQQLIIGIDIPQKANLLVTEIFDRAVIGEQALPTLIHAKRSLLKPDARIIPESATLYGVLIESEAFKSFFKVDDVCGFDLSAMNVIARPLHYTDAPFGLQETSEQRVLTAPFEIFTFNFQGDLEASFSTLREIQPTQSGTAHAIVMWFDLSLSPETTFSTRSASRKDHWRQAAQPLLEHQELSSDQSQNLLVSYQDFFDFRFLESE